jgi:hypothetical protein
MTFHPHLPKSRESFEVHASPRQILMSVRSEVPDFHRGELSLEVTDCRVKFRKVLQIV